MKRQIIKKLWSKKILLLKKDVKERIIKDKTMKKMSYKYGYYKYE